jgi:mannosyltransferase OCH1-like enzyme
MLYISFIILICILCFLLILIIKQKQTFNKTLSYNQFKKKYILVRNKKDDKVIPKIIFRTGPFKLNELPSVVKTSMNKLLKNNPDYTQIYFDDDDCRAFIEEFFPEYLPDYDILIPTAFKADLWRLLVIYKYGGIYNDLGHDYITPISNIVTKTDYTVLCIDDKIHPYTALYNAFFATYPENNIIKHLINTTINNIRNRIYGTHPLSITGPYAWGIAINNLLNKPSNSTLHKGTIPYKDETITF